MTLSASGTTSRLRLGDRASPHRRANRIALDGRDLSEWLAAGPLGLEQGFVVTRRPAAEHATLTLALRLGGTLRPRVNGTELDFVDGTRRSLRYAGLAAVDAVGHRLRAALSVHNGLMQIRVADRDAVYPVSIDPMFESSVELVGTCVIYCTGLVVTELGNGDFGYSVAVSGNGSTVIVGTPFESNDAGSATVYSLASNGFWTKEARLVGNCVAVCGGPSGTGEYGAGEFGESVALSNDGTVALIGAPLDNETIPSYVGNPPLYSVKEGAAWVFTQSAGTWSQQGQKLIAYCGNQYDDKSAQGTGPVTCGGASGTGENGQSAFGYSVALSGDGSAALIGAPLDTSGPNGPASAVYGAGAAWVFTSAAGNWSQATELTADCTTGCGRSLGTGEAGAGQFGWSVSLAADGTLALIGAPDDSRQSGAAWTFARGATTWSQQAELAGSGSGEIGAGMFGFSVSLAADGTAAAIGAPDDNGEEGAAWTYSQVANTWTPQTELLADCSSGCGGPRASGEGGAGFFGYSVATSADGTSTIVGATNDSGESGAAWTFTSTQGAWSSQQVVGDCASGCSGGAGEGESGSGQFGASVSISGDGTVAAIGAPADTLGLGAAWIVGATPSATAPTTLSGTPAVGQTLSCSAGTWGGNPTGFSYEWESDGSIIAGETGQTYTVQTQDQGGTITCLVFGFNAAGAGRPSTSNGLAVPSPIPVPTTPPYMLGASSLGSTLACVAGDWTNTPIQFDYEWLRDGVAIANQPSDAYTISTLDEGSKLTCSVVAQGPLANSQPVSTTPLSIPIVTTSGCPKTSGSVTRSRFGRIVLGETRAQARAAYAHSTDTKATATDTFCLTPLDLTVGYYPPKLPSSAGKGTRGKLAQNVIWAASASPLLALQGIRTGEALTSIAGGLHLGRPVTVTLTKKMTATWVAFPYGPATTGLLQVSDGSVIQVAIAERPDTSTASKLIMLLRQLPRNAAAQLNAASAPSSGSGS